LAIVIATHSTVETAYATREAERTGHVCRKPMPNGALARVATTPTTIPVFLPTKPKAMRPRTTPTPMTDSTSQKMPQAPASGMSSKRTTENSASAARTEIVNAMFVTRFQYRLVITGNTRAPQSAPTKTSRSRIPSSNVAMNIPATIATIIVMRPMSSIVFGFAFLRPAMFWPYTSAMTIDDSAARSESEVDDSDPMIITKKTQMRIGPRYVDAICGMMLLVSPSNGEMPRYRAMTPSMPTPMTVAP